MTIVGRHRYHFALCACPAGCSCSTLAEQSTTGTRPSLNRHLRLETSMDPKKEAVDGLSGRLTWLDRWAKCATWATATRPSPPSVVRMAHMAHSRRHK
jgi:hypothetical protein